MVKFEVKVEFVPVYIQRGVYDDPTVEVVEGFILAQDQHGSRWEVIRESLPEESATAALQAKARELTALGITEPEAGWVEMEPAYGSLAWEADLPRCTFEESFPF